MSRANHLWGAPHIHGELLKLGFTIAQSTVARYMYRGWPPSQGWRTFLTNHVDGIAAIDLLLYIVHVKGRLPWVFTESLPMSAMCSFAVRFTYSIFLAYHNRISGALPVERPSPVWAEREFKLAPRVPIRGANSSPIAREYDRRQRRSWSRAVFELSPCHRRI